MPPVFTTQLASRLDSKSKLSVVEAKDGDVVKGGTVYLAPGDFHMEVHSMKTSKVIKLTKGPKENSCRPAVDVLFRSVAKCYGAKCAGVIMTGMGKDGFEGAKIMKQKGSPIIAQDEETCVVYGMPKFVIEAGLADYICSLDRIAHTIQELAGF
jgi:two-component system chemotaxis response regulator CheB